MRTKEMHNRAGKRQMQLAGTLCALCVSMYMCVCAPLQGKGNGVFFNE